MECCDTDITAPASGYTENWNKISLELKERYNWTCQQCGRVFKDNGLHVHYIDGVKSNNKESNLKVLCKYCHAEQPNHQHMKQHFQYLKNDGLVKIQTI